MHRRTTALAALALTSVLALGACGSDDEPTSSKDGQGSDTSQTGDGARVEVSHKDGLFDPNGARIKVGIGEPLTVIIDADTEGSLHVHSTPEQEIEYGPGTSEHEIVIDRPGVVEVESHDPTTIVLQLEVS